MGVEGVSGLAVAATAGGALLLWSGLKGAKVSTALGSVISGQQPSGTDTDPITASYDASQSTAPASSSTGTAVAPANASESAFWTSVLTTMGAPATSANINSLAAWFHHEEPSWPPPATNNPLNSTQPAAGSTTFNSVGVQNYPNVLEGISATVKTLTNGYYPQIEAALKAGTGVCGSGFASEFATWSGPGGYTSVC